MEENYYTDYYTVLYSTILCITIQRILKELYSSWFSYFLIIIILIIFVVLIQKEIISAKNSNIGLVIVHWKRYMEKNNNFRDDNTLCIKGKRDYG